MIGNATNAPHSGRNGADASRHASKDATGNGAKRTGRDPGRGTDGARGTGTGDARGAGVILSETHTDSLYVKVTNADGDVLELRAESTESVRIAATAGGAAHPHGSHGPHQGAIEGPESPDAEAQAADDPKAKQLAELRAWAKRAEHELRKQQHALLEQILKHSGRRVDTGNGRFLNLGVEGPEAGKAAEEADAEALVPPYWNAENTSDRIVHFATQMAEISGLDPEEFVEKIKDAVSKGFDQAAAATGPLTGAAAKLNKDTRDLVFTKLSKWLEDRESLPYNQGAEKPADTGAESAQGQA